MKQVWILNHYAKIPGEAGGTRHFHLGEHLTSWGWQASVIAANARDGGGRSSTGRKRTVRERIKDVTFLWVSTPTYEGNGGGRIANMLAYSVRVLWPGTTRDLAAPDVIVGSSVHPFAALSGALLALWFRVPFVFEVRDLWPQTLVDMGRLKEGQFVTWAMRKLERWLYRRAARTVVLLPRAWEYIVPLGVAREKIEWIPNGVDLSLFKPTLPRSLNGAEPFTLMYFGSHGQANGLDIVLSAMQIVQRERGAGAVRLRLIGDGPLKRSLMQKSDELKLDNIEFEAPVPKLAIPKLAAQADAFVIAVLNLPKLYRYGISMNKLFDYLAAQRPIIIASDAINNPVEDAKAGLTVPAGRPDALASAILKLVDTPFAVRQQMGRAGREYVEKNHGFEQLAQRFAQVLTAALKE